MEGIHRVRASQRVCRISVLSAAFLPRFFALLAAGIFRPSIGFFVVESGTGMGFGGRAFPPVDVFLSGADAAEDRALRAELEAHLTSLADQGLLRLWHRDKVGAGEERRRTIDEHIESARFILLLVSARYLASDEGRVEVTRAMSRRGPAVIVPVLLSPVDWEGTPFSAMQPLPSRVPVTQWPSRDEAWSEVARNLRTLLEARTSRPPPPSSGPVSSRRAVNPTYADRMTRALSERLEEAFDRKARLEEVGQDTEAVALEILDLKRQLRAAGHLKAGDVLGNGRYLLMKQLGKGGYATVWRARDKLLNIDVAIKVLRPDFAADPIRRQRFVRGARVMGKMRHESIVRVLDVPPNDIGWHYYVMELLTGGDLRETVLSRRMGHEQLLSLVLRIGGALTEVHAARWVHRDVKPTNIVLTDGGVPKLTDFDLVGGPDTTGGTTGPLGSPVYAAPELITRPQEVTARADVYSLGMTTLFALHGEDWPDDILLRNSAQKLIQRIRCSDQVKDVLARAVDLDADRRFRDAAAYCDALSGAIGAPISSPAPASIPAPVSDSFFPEWTDPQGVAPVMPIDGYPVPGEAIDIKGIRTERITIEAPPLRDMPLLKISDAFLVTVQSPGGSSAGGKLTLVENPTRIGRDLSGKGGGIVLSHGSVSRVHARIELRGFSLFLIDEGSTNGTFVTTRARFSDKDKVFGVTMLQYGDFISIGREYSFQLELRQHVGGAAHLQEFERLKTDAPTGLLSRRYLDWCLEREALRAQQQRQSLAFVVLRILKRPDHTPALIDGLLSDLAKVIEQERTAGLVGRFGQRSLGVLIKGTAEEASALGYAVRQKAPASMSVRFGAAEILAGDKDPAGALRTRVVSKIDLPPGEGGSDM